MQYFCAIIPAEENKYVKCAVHLSYFMCWNLDHPVETHYWKQSFLQ